MSRRGFPRGTVSALHEHWEFVPAFLVAARTEAAGRPVSVPSVGRARQSLHFPLLSNVSVNLRRVSGDNAPGIFTGIKHFAPHGPPWGESFYSWRWKGTGRAQPGLSLEPTPRQGGGLRRLLLLTPEGTAVRDPLHSPTSPPPAPGRRALLEGRWAGRGRVTGRGRGAQRGARGAGRGGGGRGRRAGAELWRGSPGDAPVTSAAAGGISRPLPGARLDPGAEWARPTWAGGSGAGGRALGALRAWTSSCSPARGAERAEYLASADSALKLGTGSATCAPSASRRLSSARAGRRGAGRGW